MQIAHPLAKLITVSIDIIDEESMPCDYCGATVQFFDDDFAVCPGCGNEFWNMDFTGELPGDVPGAIT